MRWKYKSTLFPRLLQRKCKTSNTSTFIAGTNAVSKHSVDRHLGGKAHNIAVEEEARKPAAKRLNIEGTAIANHPSFLQLRIDTAIRKASTAAYERLFKAAYRLALNPTMPLKHFSVLTEILRDNGVPLIKNKTGGKHAKEFIGCMAQAVLQQIAQCLSDANFFSILSDGSQPKKTRAEKELVLSRLEKNGVGNIFFDITSRYG